MVVTDKNSTMMGVGLNEIQVSVALQDREEIRIAQQRLLWVRRP